MSASKPMRVLVTGATGVVGVPTVHRLVAAGHEVRATTRRAEGAEAVRAAGAQPVPTDLFDAASVAAAVHGADAVLHLATNVPAASRALRRSAWRTHNRLRTEATRLLVDAASAAGSRVFVKESVSFVYRDGGDRWLDEDSPVIERGGPMVESTLEGERAASAFAGAGRRAVVLRFGLFYGPRSRSVDEMLRLARWRSSMLAGRSGAFVSSIHHDDAAAAVVAALDVPSGLYNVVDDEPVTRREYLDAFAAAFGTRRSYPVPAPVVGLLAGRAARLMTASQRVSNRKLRGATSWTPELASVRAGFVATARRREGAAGA